MFKILGKTLCLLLALLFPPKDRILPVAHNTWAYFDKVTYANGLPDDRMEEKDGKLILPDRTSPTNIGLYLFSVSCARNLQIIDKTEAERRVHQTITTLSKLERRHGFYLNWYKASTGEHMTEWVPGRPLPAFLSSVDNAWLAASLVHVEQEYPSAAVEAKKILDAMDFRFFYDPAEDFFFGGYDDDLKQYTGFHYGILNSETRLVSYVAIRAGQVPKSHLHKLVKVKRDDKLVSSYGSMFEGLVVPLFVPEIEESPRWKDELTRYAKFQIDNGVEGIWGQSYSDDARGIYKEYGLEKLAQYPAHFEHEGVVTPYASFLALQFDKEASLKNIEKLSKVAYGTYGFYGAYRPRTLERASSVLTLEQAIIMMSIADFENKNPSKACFRGIVEPNFP